ncbi:hypothetical protein NL316_27475, partial [Klebsiella pneumoniae]|nr:hypothetical protein [Klebsiella pneumoniae]
QNFYNITNNGTVELVGSALDVTNNLTNDSLFELNGQNLTVSGTFTNTGETVEANGNETVSGITLTGVSSNGTIEYVGTGS